MRFLYLLFSLFMFWFADLIYNYKNPEGLRLNHFSDIVSAIFYQPHIYAVILLMLIAAVNILIFSGSQSIKKMFAYRNASPFRSLIQFILSLLVAVQGYLYFPHLSIFLYICFGIIHLFIFLRRRGEEKRKRLLQQLLDD